MKKQKLLIGLILLLGVFLVFPSGCKKDDDQDNTEIGDNAFKDSRDGNVYKTVKIGNQTWMAENLKYLPSLTYYYYVSEIVPYYYVYGYAETNLSDAKATANYSTYGVLYNWAAANIACPQGWHLPSNAEWTELIDSIGSESNAGGKLKEVGVSHWKSPNVAFNTKIGFNALPGGYRDFSSVFYYIGNNGYWWSATESNVESAKCLYMTYDVSNIYRSDLRKSEACSIRCIKD